MKKNDLCAPQHLTKKVIIIENNTRSTVFQPNLEKLNQARPLEKQAIVEGSKPQDRPEDVLQQFVQENKAENVNISQKLAEQSRLEPFNRYLKQMGVMLETNQRKISELQSTIGALRERVQQAEDRMVSLEQQMKQGDSRKKKNRRTAAEIEKQFKIKISQCPYENCEKLYGSEVSMNLHIKIKHNGGSKTERERAAKLLIEQQGLSESLDLSINLPPQLLESIKQQIKQEKSEKAEQ